MARSRMVTALERIRLIAFAAGCALLFWQQDAAAVDWLFGLGILLSVALWTRTGSAFIVAWPQLLLVLYLGVTFAVTWLLGGDARDLAIITYLVLCALALGSLVRNDPARQELLGAALTLAALITAATVIAGSLSDELGLPFESLAAYGLRGRGLFKDPNVAGAFVAATFPVAAAACFRSSRYRVGLLLLVTLAFEAGVFFSFSRMAILMLGGAALAVAVAFVLRGERHLAAAILGPLLVPAIALATIGSASADRLFQLRQIDERSRLITWAFGTEFFMERPLGTGAGSFEPRSDERWRALVQTFGRRNLIVNGAIEGDDRWTLHPNVSAAADPTSITGYSLKRTATARRQNAYQVVGVTPGQTYSFAAQVRSDGGTALLMVAWHDETGRQELVEVAPAQTSTVWRETVILDRVAPPWSANVAVIFTNDAPGTQHATAFRMHEGSTVPPWSADEQVPVGAPRPPFVTISAHNTYLRAAVESGAFGFIALVGYLGALLLAGWRHLGRELWHWPLALSLVVVAGLVIDTLHWRFLWVYVAVVAGLAWSASSATVVRRGRTV